MFVFLQLVNILTTDKLCPHAGVNIQNMHVDGQLASVFTVCQTAHLNTGLSKVFVHSSSQRLAWCVKNPITTGILAVINTEYSVFVHFMIPKWDLKAMLLTISDEDIGLFANIQYDDI